MKTHKDIEQNVKATIDAFDSLSQVNVPPFFKDKTMNRLFLDKQTSKVSRLWLSPQLQFALLISVIVLNIYAFSQLNSETYDTNLTEFAEDFGLSEEDTTLALLKDID